MTTEELTQYLKRSPEQRLQELHEMAEIGKSIYARLRVMLFKEYETALRKGDRHQMIEIKSRLISLEESYKLIRDI